MSSGYSLRPDCCWLPANWVARAVADRVLPHLTGSFAEAVGVRVRHVHLYPGALGSFEDASAEELRTLREAVRLGRETAERDGPKGWSSPEMFPGFLRAFDELLAALASDPRLTQGADRIA